MKLKNILKKLTLNLLNLLLKNIHLEDIKNQKKQLNNFGNKTKKI